MLQICSFAPALPPVPLELGEESPRCRMPAWLTTRMQQTWPQLPGHSQTKTTVLKQAILVVYENLTCFHVVLKHNLHPHL